MAKRSVGFYSRGVGLGCQHAVVPLQDLLGLGTEARMNLPNSTTVIGRGE